MIDVEVTSTLAILNGPRSVPPGIETYILPSLRWNLGNCSEITQPKHMTVRLLYPNSPNCHACRMDARQPPRILHLRNDGLHLLARYGSH